MITNKTVLPGAWYAIPLRRPESYGVGVITHTNPSHSHLIGYFFGPPRTHHPTLYETVSYRSTDAVLVARFGFGAAQWPLLGHDPNWASALWPMPIFGRIVIPPGIGVKVEYADTDPATIVRETRTTVNEARRLPSDGYLGYQAVEIVLAQRLTELAAHDQEATEQEATEQEATEQEATEQEDSAAISHPGDNQSGTEVVIVHIAHFVSEYDADITQVALSNAGYQISLALATDPQTLEHYWSVRAEERILNADQLALNQSCQTVERIVKQANGVYDGYERSAPSRRSSAPE